MKLRLRRHRFGQLVIVSTVISLLSNITRKTIAQSRRNIPTVNIKLQVNAKGQALQVEPRVTLLDALREYIGLTGT